jgi:hypothetical protein
MLLRHIPKEHLNETEYYCIKTLSEFKPTNEEAIEQLIKIIFNATRDFEFVSLKDSSNICISLESISRKLQNQNERHELIEILVSAEANYRGKNIEGLAAQIENIATYLNLDDDCLSLSRNIAKQSKDKAYEDWIRHNWSTNNQFEDSSQKQITARFHDVLSKTIIVHKEDDELITKMKGLSTAPANSIGQKLWAFIQDHHFTLPGLYGGASSTLQRHDWIHVIGDYETDFIGELECAAFGATSSNEPGANLWFIGMIAMIAGQFDIGTDMSNMQETINVNFKDSQIQKRLTKAIKRGKGSKVDLLSIDFFEISHEPIDKIKDRFGI